MINRVNQQASASQSNSSPRLKGCPPTHFRRRSITVSSRMNASFLTALPFLVCLLLLSSRAATAELTYDNGKLFVPKMSKNEIRKLRKQAESLPMGVIPNDAQGGVWFDGMVEEALSNDEFGQPIWLVRVDRIFLDRIKSPVRESKFVLRRQNEEVVRCSRAQSIEFSPSISRKSTEVDRMTRMHGEVRLCQSPD